MHTMRRSMRFFSKAAVWIGTAGLICVASFFVDGAEPASPPYGLEERVPWTTSNVRGRPEPPPPYRPERVYSKLRFKGTTLMDVVPGSGQLLVGEQGGKIFLLPKDRDAEKADKRDPVPPSRWIGVSAQHVDK